MNHGESPSTASASFRAVILRKQDDLPRYVVLPADAARALGMERTSTVEGLVAGMPISRQAVKPMGDGTWFLDIKQTTAVKAGVDTGDEIDIELRRVSEEPPADLVEALAANPTAAEVWDRLSASQKRQVVNDVMKAKKPETRAKRIADYVGMLGAAPDTHRHKYGDLAP